jgi:hypothetical protein
MAMGNTGLLADVRLENADTAATWNGEAPSRAVLIVRATGGPAAPGGDT